MVICLSVWIGCYVGLLISSESLSEVTRLVSVFSIGSGICLAENPSPFFVKFWSEGLKACTYLSGSGIYYCGRGGDFCCYLCAILCWFNLLKARLP